jgi:RHS repeat-associated protein
VLNGTTKTYTYDTTDQLTADGTNTFTYDGVGNRTNGSYTTGTGNRLTNDGTWTYTYDDEGNLTKKSKGASQETWTYTYDHKNQMLSVEKRATDGGTLQMRADYKYDVFGNRIQKAVDNDGNGSVDTTQKYSYDGWKRGPQQSFIGNENWDVWADLDGASALQTRYLRGDVIDQLFARIDSGTAYWLLTDRMGSNRDVVDGSGVKDTISYDGFGNIAAETDSTKRGRYAWTGRELDTETNLQYNRARYYDGKIGRWTSQDPLGFDAGDSNVYRYVRNKPMTLSDPTGLQLTDLGTSFRERPFGIDKISASINATFDSTTGVLIGYFRNKGNLDHVVTPKSPSSRGSVYWMQVQYYTVKAFYCDQTGNAYPTAFLGVTQPASSGNIVSSLDPYNPVLNVDVIRGANAPFYYYPWPAGSKTFSGGFVLIKGAEKEGYMSFIWDQPDFKSFNKQAIIDAGNPQRKNAADPFIGFQVQMYFVDVPAIFNPISNRGEFLGAFVEWRADYFKLSNEKLKGQLLKYDNDIANYLNTMRYDITRLYGTGNPPYRKILQLANSYPPIVVLPPSLVNKR